MRWSTLPSKGQQHCNPRSSASLRSEAPSSLLQPPQPGPQVRPPVVMGGRGPRCTLLCSLGLSLFPGVQLSHRFVPGQWRQASLALFRPTLHFFISCRQTAHIMLAFHAQYS